MSPDRLLHLIVAAALLYVIAAVGRLVWRDVRGIPAAPPSAAPARPAGSWHAVRDGAPCACGWGRGHLGRRSAYLCARAWSRRHGRPARVVFVPVTVTTPDPWSFDG